MPRPASALGKLLAAYAAVYLIWGSTYLAVRYAIETLPPFLMSGARFVIAGGILYAWLRARGTARPAAADWRAGVVTGALIVLIGFGVFAWGQYYVTSSVAAVIGAMLPLWIVLLHWLAFHGPRPRVRVATGIVLGLGGIALLVAPGGAEAPPEARGSQWIGIAALLGASIAYALGSLLSRRAPVPGSPLMAAAIQMLLGGAMMVAVGMVIGEGATLWATVDGPGVAARSWLAFAYLTLFGAVVAYAAYVWLLEHDTPARATTYAYVNPVIAVVLGWAIAGERVTSQMLVAAAIILAGVALITLGGGRRGISEHPTGEHALRDESAAA